MDEKIKIEEQPPQFGVQLRVSKPVKGEKVDCYIDRYYGNTGEPVEGTLIKKIKGCWQIKLFNNEVVYLAENAVWGFNQRKAC